jgi:tetratricopeptide (TPR) repeat protein
MNTCLFELESKRGKFPRCLLLVLAVLASGCQTVSLPGFSGGSTPREVPAAARAQFEAAVTAQRAQQWPEAERQFNQLLEKYPYLSGPALNLALLCAQTQRPQQAEDYFRRALRINPGNAAAGVQYGVWLRTQGRFAEAEAIYLQTLERSPDDADAHLNLAILYDLYLGRPEVALDHYQRYLTASGAENSPVQGWIADLQRRLQSGGAS